MSVDPRARALSALARFQVTDDTVGGTLNRIAEITLEAMPSAAIVGMTMLGEDEQPTTAIYTNPDSPEIDAAPQRTLGAALAGIAEASTVSVPGCDAASIAISIAGRPATAAVTARVALELDMVQYDTEDGPCLTSFQSMRTVRVNLVEQGDAFPHLSEAARRKGFKGVLSVPATWGNEVVATLNLTAAAAPSTRAPSPLRWFLPPKLRSQ